MAGARKKILITAIIAVAVIAAATLCFFLTIMLTFNKEAAICDYLDKNGVTLSIDESPSPDMLLDHAELNKAIEEAIASLSPQAALAIQLRRFENLSYEEIATILEITVPATKSLIFRARQSLKEKLASFLNS